LFALTGGTQPPSPPYFQGRFSNGPVWVELLAPELGITFAQNRNFATGGAESGSGGAAGGVTAQLAQSSAIPVSSTTLGVVWAGANDYLNRLATTPPATLVAQTVGNIGTAMGTMAARGVRTIIVGNLPDLGKTPGGASQGAATAFNLGAVTNIHNTALHGAARSVEAATGARVVVLDSFGLFNDVLTNPSLYGISNTTVPCITPAGATGACATAAAAQATLFFDPIHPTATAHNIIARYAEAQLDQNIDGARVAAITSFLGPVVLENVRRGVTDRLDVLRASNTRERSTLPNGAYGSVKYTTGDRDDSAGVAGFDYKAVMITAGYDTVVADSFVLGGSATYADGSAEEDLGRADTKFTSYAISAYIGYRNGPLWLDLSGIGSWENYDIDRHTGFAARPTATADVGGNSFMISADTGFNVAGDNSNTIFGPVVGIRYVNSDLDAYNEDGAAMLNMTSAERSSVGTIGSIGLQASTLMVSGGSAFVPYLRAAYEKEFNELDYNVALGNAVGQTRTVSGGTGNDDRVVVSGGINVQAGAGMAFSLGYGGTVAKGDGADHTVVGRIVYSF